MVRTPLAAISCTVLSPRSASSATAALNLSEKFRRFVMIVSIHSGWIHLSTLSKFAGPLQRTQSDHSSKVQLVAASEAFTADVIEQKDALSLKELVYNSKNEGKKTSE